ncbi:hypothetical protein ACFE04_023752 [Oxalis oulophora]
MASFTILFSSLLLVASSIVYSSEAAEQTVISTICSNTSNPVACNDFLNTDPRTANASLRYMSLISIDLTYKQAEFNLKYYTDLYKIAITAEMEEAFERCLAAYHAIEFNLVDAYKRSGQLNYVSVGHTLSKVQSLASKDCASKLPVSWLPSIDINNDMYLKVETCISLNKYIKKLQGKICVFSSCKSQSKD